MSTAPQPSRSSAVGAETVVANLDQVVLLRGVSWDQFEALAQRENASVRMAYLDGDLEIMSPSRPHETWKTTLARLLEVYAEEKGMTMAGFGSETYRKKAKRAGVEADESYCFDEEKRFPDLAIEVVVSHSSIDKLEIYRRLGVGEVWLADRRMIRVFRLAGKRYVEGETSALFPALDLRQLWRIVQETPPIRQTDAVRAFRRTLTRRDVPARRGRGR